MSETLIRPVSFFDFYIIVIIIHPWTDDVKQVAGSIQDEDDQIEYAVLGRSRHPEGSYWATMWSDDIKQVADSIQDENDQKV